MSVMNLNKKVCMDGGVGGVSPIQFFRDFWISCTAPKTNQTLF